MIDDGRPQPDKIDGAPHPRDTATLFGQDGAQHGFLDAFNSGRLHHGWLVTGPRGVGKATLTYRIARFLLSQPMDDGGMFGAPEAPASLDTPPEHPVARRMNTGAEPGLFVLKRGGAGSTESEQQKNFEAGKFAKDIRVDDARKLKNFFAMSAADGGRRVVIVDSADEMNVSAANALLKLLEEPPERATLLLVSHQPSRLLPTIRSRCRELRLAPLAPDALSAALDQAVPDADTSNPGLTALTSGSVGEAIRMANLGGLELYTQLTVLMDTMPRMNRQRAVALAEAAAQRGAEIKRDLLIDMILLFLARLARAGSLGYAPSPEAVPGEAEIIARLSPNPHKARKWAETEQFVSDRLAHGRAVNLDPSALILDTLMKIQQTAAA